MFKYHPLRGVIALTLAIFIVFGIVPSIVFAADPSPGAVAIANTINDYTGGAGASGSLTAVADGDTIMVTGSIMGATDALILLTSSSVTVLWNATLHSTNDGAIGLMQSTAGSPVFRMIGGEISSANNNPAIRIAMGNWNIEIAGGTVTSTGSAISAGGMASTVRVSGGLVYNEATSASYPVINMSNTNAVIENVVISGTGVVEARGSSGTAVESFGSISISGGEVRAADGLALHAKGASSAVNVSGGVVFAHGTSISDDVIVLSSNPGGFSDPTGDGVVLAWNQAAGVTEYLENTATHITKLPAEATASWQKIGNEHGIAYTNGGNSDLLALPVTVLTPQINVTSSGLENLKVGVPVEGEVTFELEYGEYVDVYTIVVAAFLTSELPDGLVMDYTARESETIVTFFVVGAPTTAGDAGFLALPASIPASNVVGATSPVPVMGAAPYSVIAKGDGGVVSGVPTEASSTADSITVNAVTNAGISGQTVEYVISTSASPVPTDGWQSGVSFDGLDPETVYYVFARTAENSNYEAGSVQVSEAITTAAASLVAVEWVDLGANGASDVSESDMLTLLFGADPATLALSDITVTGASKGMLLGSGTSRVLTITDITVDNGETITIEIANPAGYEISPSSMTVVVWRAVTVTSVTVSPGNASVEKGDTEQFAATVQGEKGPSQTVTWSIDGPHHAGTTIVNGLLSVHAEETETSLTIRAASTVNGSVSGTATVTVTSPPTYGISLDKSGVQSFSEATVGYAAQAGIDVVVSNTGNQATGALTIALSDDAGFVLSATSISDVAVGGDESFTVTPKNDLAVGTYSSTVMVSGGNGISESFEVRFAVAAASGSGSSGGGSGGNTTVPPVLPPVTIDKQPNEPTTATTSLDGSTKDGDSSVTITAPMVQNALDKVKDEEDGVALIFDVSGSGAAGQTVHIEADALDLLVSSGVKHAQVETDSVKFSFDTAALAELSRQTMGAITLRMVPAPAKAGLRPAFDIYLVDSSGRAVTSLGRGVMTLAIAYEQTNAEDAALIMIRKLVNGRWAWVNNSGYENKWVTWNDSPGTVFGVAYRLPAPRFIDVAGHWALRYIDTVADWGVMRGTSEITFSPDESMTRGMFVTVLGRLSGVGVGGFKNSSFTDVLGHYCAPHAEWARVHGIVKGIGGDLFAPEKFIAREDMAVMLANYASVLNYPLPVTTAASFVDAESVSDYAKDAVAALWQAGVVIGRGGDVFDPKGKLTRAEAAVVVERFVELVINAAPPRAWVQNSSRQWLYRDLMSGKEVTGWQTIGIFDEQYYFYPDGIMAANTDVEGHRLGADGAKK
jgi:FOG: Glucan-binding domain (YG repeat)